MSKKIFVLVAETSHGYWADYYVGKTYIHQGECFPVISNTGSIGAKVYTSKKRAERAAESIGDKVGRSFIVEEIKEDSNMNLPEGKTCGDCFHWKRCSSLIDDLDGKENTCDFAPIRYREKVVHENG